MRAGALAALLEEERRLLLAADWDALDALWPQKAAALGGLAAATPAEGARLAEGLARNQALLAAAVEGVREALRRRAALREAQGLVTYDAGGARMAQGAPAPRLERRA